MDGEFTIQKCFESLKTHFRVPGFYYFSIRIAYKNGFYYTPRGGLVIDGHYIKLFLAPVLWGGALVAGRIVAPQLPPFTLTFLRFSAVSLFLIPALYIKTGRYPVPNRREVLLLVFLSATGILFFNVFLFSGLRTVTAARSAVIIAFTPAVVALVSALFFGEKIRPLMAIGILLAFVGALTTITEGDLSTVFRRGISRGDLFLLGCVLSWTIYSLIAKSVMKGLDPLTVLTYGSIIGSVLLIPFVLREGVVGELASQPLSTWLGLLYLSVGAAGIAYLWYYEGIRAVGASRAAIFLNLEPVAAIVLGILILGENPSFPVAIGAALVIGGLYLTNYRP